MLHETSSTPKRARSGRTEVPAPRRQPRPLRPGRVSASTRTELLTTRAGDPRTPTYRECEAALLAAALDTADAADAPLPAFLAHSTRADDLPGPLPEWWRSSCFLTLIRGHVGEACTLRSLLSHLAGLIPDTQPVPLDALLDALEGFLARLRDEGVCTWANLPGRVPLTLPAEVIVLADATPQAPVDDSLRLLARGLGLHHLARTPEGTLVVLDEANQLVRELTCPSGTPTR